MKQIAVVTVTDREANALASALRKVLVMACKELWESDHQLLTVEEVIAVTSLAVHSAALCVGPGDRGSGDSRAAGGRGEDKR